MKMNIRMLITGLLAVSGLQAMDPGLYQAMPSAAQNKFELDSALWLAASKGDESEVKRLINLKANVNTDNFMGVTTLMIAAENGHAQVVQTLLRHGANANAQAKGYYNRFALRQAAQEGHLEIIKALLTTIPDADLQAMRNGYYALLDSMGQRGMKVSKDMRMLVADRFINALVEKRMEQVVQPMVDLQDANHQTALEIALLEKQRTIARREHYQSIVNLLNLTLPQSQEEIRTLIKANIWRILKAKPKSNLPITQGASWDEMLGEFEPMEESE